jgi:hypothetical protein
MVYEPLSQEILKPRSHWLVRSMESVTWCMVDRTPQSKVQATSTWL